MPRVTFIHPDGARQEIDAADGQTLLEIAWENRLDIEGTCGGVVACSTCHIIVAADWHDRLPAPTREENEMLDLAWGLTPTSRLGCQITMTGALDGLVVMLPDETRSLLD